MQHEGSVTKAERNAIEAAEHRGIETGISLAIEYLQRVGRLEAAADLRTAKLVEQEGERK